jgi:outer membrane murein-binding lipoprotein Lpp
MSEEIKSVDAKIDELEAGVKKYASKDTVISIGGYEFTPAKLMIAFTIVSSTLGGLYGCFEVYKDYQDMKSKIAKYVTPDLTEVYKKLAVIEENSQKTSDYTRDIKNDLKNDIRRLEGVVESVERNSKQMAREATQAQKETDTELRQVRKEIDSKIQRALDNPLAK